MKTRKIAFLVLGSAALALVLPACQHPPEPARSEKPPEKVLRVVKAPKGGGVAEVIQRGERQLVRVEGLAGPEYEEITGLAFMTDGHQLVYEGRRGGRWFLVLDGKEWPMDAEVVHDSIRVSPDYRRLALLGHQDGKWQAMVDGRPHPPFQFIWAETLQFSPDSQHVGYLALDGNTLAVVVDGKVAQRFDILKKGKETLTGLLKSKGEPKAK